MGSQKRSKPNPKAEAEVEPELPAHPGIPKSEGQAKPRNGTEVAVSKEANQNTEAVSSTDIGTTNVGKSE